MKQIPLPKLLQEIPDPPKQLYIRGVFPAQENLIFLTIVGSRKYTSYGRQVCQKLIRSLRGYPFVIVSGLALGIDSIAHETALDIGLLTVAIPGSGLSNEVLYPASNRQLAQKIIQSGGCLVSEFEPDFKATLWSFPKRNRIMAGISHAILVIESENISGTRITARLATEYNREVFAVPGSIFSEQSKGNNELIREGATPVTEIGDILECFGFDKKQQQENNLTKQEESLIKLLEEPQSRNELAEKLSLPIYELSILVSTLEIRGLLQEQNGKIYLHL